MIANEVAACTVCHALIHAGLLRVSVGEHGELRWEPVSFAEFLERAVGTDGAVADRLPVLHLERKAKESTNADCVLTECALNLDDLRHGLMRLGWSSTQSKQAISKALEGLPPRELTEANVLRRALSSSRSLR